MTGGELRTGVLVGAIAADAHEGGDGGAAEDRTLAVVETMATAEVGQLAKPLQQVVQSRRLEGTGTGDLGLEVSQRLGQLSLTQEGKGTGNKRTQVELLRLPMREVEVTGDAIAPPVGPIGSKPQAR